MEEREGLILAWEWRLEFLAHDVQRTEATGRRVRLLVLVASAIDTADNKKSVVWAEISLVLVVVAPRFVRKLLQVLEQKRWSEGSVSRHAMLMGAWKCVTKNPGSKQKQEMRGQTKAQVEKSSRETAATGVTNMCLCPLNWGARVTNMCLRLW